MSDNGDVMLQVMKDMREEQREHAKLSASHREETMKWQIKTDSRTERIEEDLSKHIEGVVQNRETIKLNQGRLSTLEKPLEVSKYLYKKYIKVATVISISLGIIFTAIKILGYI